MVHAGGLLAVISSTSLPRQRNGRRCSRCTWIAHSPSTYTGTIRASRDEVAPAEVADHAAGRRCRSPRRRTGCAASARRELPPRVGHRLDPTAVCGIASGYACGRAPGSCLHARQRARSCSSIPAGRSSRRRTSARGRSPRARSRRTRTRRARADRVRRGDGRRRSARPTCARSARSSRRAASASSPSPPRATSTPTPSSPTPSRSSGRRAPAAAPASPRSTARSGSTSTRRAAASTPRRPRYWTSSETSAA